MQCRHCKEQVAEGARVCKHCGRKPTGGGLFIKLILGLLVFAAVGSALHGITNPGPPPSAASAAGAAAEPAYTGPRPISASLASLMVRDSLNLKDPASAHFQNAVLNQFYGVAVVCGEVNARNGFGGYTGFQPFIVAGSVATTSEGASRAKWAKLWKSYCQDFNPASPAKPAK